ncbi:PucR family transcriptional regulator [Kineococcus sp. SYSU DK006]|uniref:PucR family transcriptional regulator n=1 Tax=Kineococcus sp. SYSU DK006 TaxID=3383127 RepID=UPI003D7D510A
MPLTVEDVLALPVLAAGAPRLRAGEEGLAAPVRWVHVSEQTQLAGTLGGGELVLSTGMGLLDPRVDTTGYVAALAEAGAVGLVVELGQHVAALPEELVRAARAARFPLVELSRTVRFVDVTEQVHARILHEQYARLRFAERVHATFAALGTTGVPADEVLARAARLLARPVVLEDLAHRALAHAAAGAAAADVLRDWSARSRRVPPATATAAGGPEGWVVTPVGAVGDRWGRLVLPERAEVADVALVLERAAETLTVARLLAADGADPAERLVQQAHDDLLRDLLRARGVDEAELRSRARALGLPLRGSLVAVVVHVAADADRTLVASVLAGAQEVGISAPLGGRLVGALLSAPADRLAGQVLPRLARALPPGATLAAGPVVSRLAEAAEGFAEARHVAQVAAALPGRVPGAVHRTGDLGVRGLLWHLRDDARLAEFAEAQLLPLLQAPDGGRADLELLAHHLAAGGSMTRLAARLHLSRPAAYGRVERLARRLGRDLDDPETRLALHLALLARGQRPEAPER